EGEVARVAYEGRVALLREEVPEQQVFGARRHVLVVDDGDRGMLFLAPGLAVAREERLEQALPGAEAPQRPALLEFLHKGQVEEEVGQRFGIGDAGRALGVELHELVRRWREDCVQARRGRRAPVAGLE